jgi:DNA-binding transcriptional LysR family regulator
MRDIADHPLIMPSAPGLGIYEMLVREFSRLGVNPHVICECPDISLIVSMVRAGVAASIVPRSAWETQASDTLDCLEITGTSISSSAAVVWQTGRHLSKAARRSIRMFAPTADV